MSVFAINRGKKFVIERHSGGNELWLSKHPTAMRDDTIIIAFDRPFEEVLKKNAYVILGADREDNVEIMYFIDDKFKDCILCIPRSVPREIRKLELEYNNG